ncbi:hypothetical protein L6164_017520 [Bauhinia variegata]|uniref:Uncharacterized protein n=1 Tax=Bauhinia variegata TaxID=167791 RepID=A0ACB9NBP3_BAUVA|nr:hypothetical protein L6164_017520 [Bauhinia variegata]
MEHTANSCMLISTVIATGVLFAAFSIPGGDNDAGIPHYLKKPAFLIFAVSDATALISASPSTLIFLSIIISRYAENDFLSSLPLKLMFGLLFISSNKYDGSIQQCLVHNILPLFKVSSWRNVCTCISTDTLIWISAISTLV